MPDSVVKTLQFYGRPDKETAEFRKGDTLLAMSATIVTLRGRPVLHIRGVLDQTSDPCAIIVLRSAIAQARRAAVERAVWNGGKG